MTEKKELQTVMITVSRNLHSLLKEYCKRKRIKIGLGYDSALQLFLTQTKNYMGTKRQTQLTRPTKGVR